MILAIETSCDDTCAAVLGTGGLVLSSVVSSQAVHDLYGGVVPEIAARHHLELIGPAIDLALEQAGVTLDSIERVAVTQGPGLTGALLVGIGVAKGIAMARSLPLCGVDHLHGHIAASWIAAPDLEPPFVCLIASGGHTLLAEVTGEGADGWRVLGSTLDDAAGEAFDKGARLLDLGYPGGPLIEELAAAGDPECFDFPRAAGVQGLDFSFAGLKTSLMYRIRDLGPSAAERSADLAASYQAAIAGQLAERVERALESTGHDRVAIGGGVAANGAVREAISAIGPEPVVPESRFCTDNAAMIGRASIGLPDLGPAEALALDSYATGGGGIG
ncbi:MAG: tRNA (adenosine(37)-N6)-threonylcarbamoyltransferase complex transferase subunit TsaD [Actinomycetes bacterium]